MKTKARERLDAALDDMIRSEYIAGLEAGLVVAEMAAAFMTRIPDTRRQRETRGWILSAIAEARARANDNADRRTR